jgi:transposase-like protein
MNSVIRKATRQRKIFPTDDSAMKVVFFGHPVSRKEMDHAAAQLEALSEPLYARFPRSPD